MLAFFPFLTQLAMFLPWALAFPGNTPMTLWALPHLHDWLPHFIFSVLKLPPQWGLFRPPLLKEGPNSSHLFFIMLFYLLFIAFNSTDCFCHISPAIMTIIWAWPWSILFTVTSYYLEKYLTYQRTSINIYCLSKWINPGIAYGCTENKNNDCWKIKKHFCYCLIGWQ